MSLFGKLKDKLFKTSGNISVGLKKVFTHKKLDQEALDLLEETLIMSDMGTDAALAIISDLKKEKFSKEVEESEIREFIARKISEIVEPAAQELDISRRKTPVVVLVCGVNGNGKTTTIGKLAYKYKHSGKRVMLAACDTFRAAAVEQLEVWSKRSNCELVRGEYEADPASVAFRAFERAKAEKYDILLIDTAGRLHNKANLMEELAKITRVLKKLDENVPHEVLLVLDATTGQNALAQVETFKSLVKVSGLILTKLDGTAKGGILVAIAKKYTLPVYAVGVGEGIEDLDKFDPDEFGKALVGL